MHDWNQQLGEAVKDIADKTTSANTAMVLAEPPGDSVSVETSITPPVSADTAPVTSTEPSHDPFAPFYQVAQTFGVPLLKAPDRRAVRRLIERMLRTHSIAEMVRFGVSHIDDITQQYAEMLPPTEREIRVFGVSAIAIHEGLRLGAEVALAQQRIALALGGPSVSQASETPDPMAMALSSEVPPPVRKLLFASLCALPAILALAEARHHGEPIESWLADELATCWVEGQRATLKVLASVPQAGISESLVPMSDRLDLAALERDMNRARALSDAGISREISSRRPLS